MNQLSQLPAFAIAAGNETVCLGSVCGLHFRYVPNELFPTPVGDIAEVVCFGQPAGVFEIGAGRCAAFAGFDPFLVMPWRTPDRRRWALETREISLWQKQMLSIVGEEHSLAADEEAAAIPLRDAPYS